jgi:osmotically-inducible protein OsmY
MSNTELRRMSKQQRIRRSSPSLRRIVEQVSETSAAREARAEAIRASQRAHDAWLTEVLKASLVGAAPENAERIKRALSNLTANRVPACS